jgi:hypothetical protein
LGKFPPTLKRSTNVDVFWCESGYNFYYLFDELLWQVWKTGDRPSPPVGPHEAVWMFGVSEASVHGSKAR